MTDLDCLSGTTSDSSEYRVGSFALGFFGLLCAMAVGFVSVLGPPVSNSADYGYDEVLGAQTPSLSSARAVSNCAIVAGGSAKMNRTRLGLMPGCDIDRSCRHD
jgi:hypothetical protein